MLFLFWPFYLSLLVLFILAWILGDSFILVKRCVLFSPGLLHKNLITNSSGSVKLVVAS